MHHANATCALDMETASRGYFKIEYEKKNRAMEIHWREF